MRSTILTLTLCAALALGGCANARVTDSGSAAAEPTSKAEVPAQTESTAQAAPFEHSEATPRPTRQNGERFEEQITVLGMEETAHYEHLVNDTLGVEMDYDYEAFVRQSAPDYERFVSVWDEPDHPENYLEVISSPEDAETAAASLAAELSETYEVYRDTCELDGAGSSIRLVADVIKGTNRMPDHLQTVYVIPAPDGCRIAAAHCFITEAEGFFKRFTYLVNTLSVLAQ